MDNKSVCEACGCDECTEYGAVVDNGQRLLFCNEAVISCFDDFRERVVSVTTLEPQPVPSEVPFSLSHIVCTCNEGEQLNAIPDYLRGQLMRNPKNEHAAACRKCHKYYRWVLRTCWECGEPFTQTFKHPFRCITQPCCWNCLEQMEQPLCEHEKCAQIKDEPRLIVEQDLTRREKPDLSKIEFPDFDW